MNAKRIRQYLKYPRLVSPASVVELSYFLLRYKGSHGKSGGGYMRVKLNSGLQVLLNRAKRGEAETFLEMFIGEPYLHHMPKHIKQKKSPVVVDIGANIGLFTLYACTKLSKPRIYAYEPDALNFRELAQNISANGLQSQVKPFNLAVGKSGTIRFFAAEHGALSKPESLLKIDPTREKGRLVSVRSVSMQSVLGKIGHVDVLKMDCEGSEWEILKSLEGRKLDIDYLCIEYHEIGGHKAGELASFFSRNGYSVHLRDEDRSRNSGIITAVKNGVA